MATVTAKRKPPQFVRMSLHEDIVRTLGKLTVDREAGVIRNVKVLGWVSENKRRYLPEAGRQALSLYEDVKVFLNHPSKPQQTRVTDDAFGKLKNARWTSEGVYADLLYLESHPMAERVCEDAEKGLAIFGLSHNADGDTSIDKATGETIVHRILEVRSVDLVTDPATVSSLAESKGANMATRITFAKLLEAKYMPALARTRLKEELDAGLVSPEMEVDDPGETSPEDALKAGFRAAVHAIVDNDEMDMKTKLSKFKELLQAEEKLLGGNAEDEPVEEEDESDDEEDDSKDTSEGRKVGKGKGKKSPSARQLQEQITSIRREQEVREACDAASFIPTRVQMKSLVALTEARERKELIDTLKAAQGKGQQSAGKGGTGQSRPSSSPAGSGTPLQESKIPDKAAETAAWLRG